MATRDKEKRKQFSFTKVSFLGESFLLCISLIIYMKSLFAFLFSGIPDMASWTGSKYILLSVRWPKYHIKMLASKYLYFSYGTVPDYNQILFIQRSDGFYQLKRENDWFTIDPNYPDYVKYTDKEPVNDPNGHFVVVRYPPTSTGGKDIVVVMSRKYRGKYVAGQSGSSYVKLLGQDFGREMQFFYKKCNRIFNYGTGSWFCDKLP